MHFIGFKKIRVKLIEMIYRYEKTLKLMFFVFSTFWCERWRRLPGTWNFDKTESISDFKQQFVTLKAYPISTTEKNSFHLWKSFFQSLWVLWLAEFLIFLSSVFYLKFLTTNTCYNGKNDFKNRYTNFFQSPTSKKFTVTNNETIHSTCKSIR